MADQKREAAENLGESTTTPPMSSPDESDEPAARPPGPWFDEVARALAVTLAACWLDSVPKSLPPKPSSLLSGPKNESWKNDESCQSAVLSARFEATVVDKESRA